MIPDDLKVVPLEDFMPNSLPFQNNILARIENNSSLRHASTEMTESSNFISSSTSSMSSYESDYQINIMNNEKQNAESILNSKRKFFTKHEDHLLTIAAINYNQESWNSIARCVPGRTPKQCRDRWVNYLQPTLKFDPWSENEDQLLVSLVNMYGTHWTKMKLYFPDRSSNSLKNRWYWLIKNQVRAMPYDKSMVPNLQAFSNSQPLVNLKRNESCEQKFKYNNSGNYNSNIYQINFCNNTNYNMVNSSNQQRPNDNQKNYYYLSKNSIKKKNMPRISSLYHNNKLNDQIMKKKKKVIQINHNPQQLNEDDLISILPDELNW